MDKYQDEATVFLSWRVYTLQFFKAAIERYLEILSPHESEGNYEINEELSDWSSILQAVEDKIEEEKNSNFTVQFGLLGKNYGKLYDLLWKHRNYKEYLLKEKQKTIFVEAALEGDKSKLADMDRVLSLEVWGKVKRVPALVPDFINAQAQPKEKDPVIRQQITIGHLYGQFAGVNNGTLIQNQNQEVTQALTALTKLVAEQNIDNDVKQDALGDIQAIQALMTKKTPNKKALEDIFSGLQVLANITQIASVVVPHLDKIQHYINLL